MAKYALRKERGPMMEYILQPLTDVRDIGVFLTKSTKNMVILGKDFANVAKNE